MDGVPLGSFLPASLELGQQAGSGLLEMLRSGGEDDLLDFDALEDLLQGADPAAILPPLAGNAPQLAPEWTSTTGLPSPQARLQQVTTQAPGISEDNSSHFNGGHRSSSGVKAAALTSAAKSETHGDESRSGGDTEGGEKQKKKRTRTSAQMQHNRVAQQKYRERKRAEQTELQSAVERLTAQLAAMKAMELRAQELEAHNSMLSGMTQQQQGRIASLEQQVAEQAQRLEATSLQLGEQQQLAMSQQRMILDQHTKLKLQEDIIAQLKDRIKESMDAVWAVHGNPDPASVCKRMHLAVRAALENATDMEELQAMLAKVPDSVVVDICKNILHQCRDMWPQCPVLPRGSNPCAHAVGPVSAQ